MDNLEKRVRDLEIVVATLHSGDHAQAVKDPHSIALAEATPAMLVECPEAIIDLMVDQILVVNPAVQDGKTSYTKQFPET